MKAIELAKAYDPKSFEDRIYEEWKSSGLFQPQPALGGSFGDAPGKKPFVVVIPPPNVTGVLHMGHGLNHSLQDIAVRFQRMTGRPTLWLPGSDHAGIATQNVVEKRLRAGKQPGYPAGTDRHSLGREKFVEETWKVANEHKAFIQKQVAKIGDSVDWSRERFTLDEGLSKAVREVFVTLHERGLIYKGKYLVNWCTSCGTALSDDEVEKDDESGKMWRIWYELVGGASDDEIAAALVSKCAQKGRYAGADYGVVGCGDVPEFRHMGITTIAFPYEKAGEVGAKRLMGLLDETQGTLRFSLWPKLVERGSTSSLTM